MDNPETAESEFWSQWTTEVRRGVLQLLVLTILKQRPSHGFEIVRRIRKASNGLIDVPGGTIYPLLNRLEKKGLLEVVTWEFEGRKRKTYALTNLGNEAITRRLDYWQRLVFLVDKLTGRAEME